MKKIAIVFASAAMMLAGACTSKEPEKTVPQEAEQAQLKQQKLWPLRAMAKS